MNVVFTEPFKTIISLAARRTRAAQSHHQYPRVWIEVLVLVVVPDAVDMTIFLACAVVPAIICPLFHSVEMGTAVLNRGAMVTVLVARTPGETFIPVARIPILCPAGMPVSPVACPGFYMFVADATTFVGRTMVTLFIAATPSKAIASVPFAVFRVLAGLR